MRIACLLITILLSSARVFASDPVIYTTEQDKEVFDRYIRFIQDGKYTPGEIVPATAEFFLNTPYVAATLEKEPEGLVANLKELDCTTFVETVFALSKTVMEGDPAFDAFCRNLQMYRYRDGVIDGYISRLHYMTDWIYDNERKGLVNDVTQRIGGESLSLSLFFMSRNADKYPLLKDNRELIREIAGIEKEINKRSYYYIPEDKFDNCSRDIKDGDLVCFVTTIEGLDVSHVGLAKWRSGELTFVHASSSLKKVIAEPRSLKEYLQAMSKNKGLIVVRPRFF